MSLSINEIILAFQQNKPVEFKHKVNQIWHTVEASDICLSDLFDDSIEFRLKPEMITISDVSFPKPESENPKSDTEYFFPSFFKPFWVGCFEWAGDDDDYRLLKAGLVHLTKENAIAHAKALIKLSGGSYE